MIIYCNPQRVLFVVSTLTSMRAHESMLRYNVPLCWRSLLTQSRREKKKASYGELSKSKRGATALLVQEREGT